MAGYVKLYRKLESWEWYTDIPTKVLFLHCLLKANHKPNKWRGITVETGSFVTSYAKLSLETGLSVREVRSAINRLKSTHEVTHETTSEFSVIKVIKWADYQGYDDDSDKAIDTPIDKQTTSERQASDKQSTTNKNDKNIKNEKNIKDIGAFESFSNQFTQYKEPLEDYKSMRVMMKKKMTPRAEVVFIGKLEELIGKGYDGLKLIDEAVSKNWLSIYEPKSYGKSDRQDILPTHIESSEGITEQERDELFQSLNQLGKK